MKGVVAMLTKKPPTGLSDERYEPPATVAIF
jgi:hypothetical protein